MRLFVCLFMVSCIIVSELLLSCCVRWIVKRFARFSTFVFWIRLNLLWFSLEWLIWRYLFCLLKSILVWFCWCYLLRFLRFLKVLVNVNVVWYCFCWSFRRALFRVLCERICGKGCLRCWLCFLCVYKIWIFIIVVDVWCFWVEKSWLW